MPNKTPNAKLLWIQFEDVLAPRLGLNVWDRRLLPFPAPFPRRRQAAPALRGAARRPRSAHFHWTRALGDPAS